MEKELLEKSEGEGVEFKEQKPRIVAVLHSVFATPKYALSTSFSERILLYYALKMLFSNLTTTAH